MTTDEYITLKEIQAITGSSISSLCDKVKAPGVPCLKLNRAWVVPRVWAMDAIERGVFSPARTGRKVGRTEVRICANPACDVRWTVRASSSQIYHEPACAAQARRGGGDISVTDAAKLLGISKQAVSQRFKRRVLMRTDVEAMLNQKEHGSVKGAK